MTATPRFNVWPLVPVIGLIAVTIPSVWMVVVARRVQPRAVTSQPYLESLHYDERKAERHAFVTAGLRLKMRELAGRRIEFTLIIPPGAPATLSSELTVYRPSDPALDRLLPWSDPTHPLTIELPRHGRWRVTVNLHGADGISRSTTAELDIGG